MLLKLEFKCVIINAVY
ncbi:hypothetical protein Lc367_1791 [Lactobacillus crispatus EM-LC1]|nr:hypothetical protein Lc367_1791 [Lactobacillus crispatus EM-LC1]